MNIEEFEKHLLNIKDHGKVRSAACPVCEKGDPKGCHLYYREDKGRLLVHCKHGCSYIDIMAEVNTLNQDISGQEYKFLRSHKYTDENGTVIAMKIMFKVGEEKRASWKRKVGGTFVKGLDGMETPLYNLHAVLKAPPSAMIYVVEGEKDADTLSAMGYIATSSPHGSNWNQDHSAYLRLRKVMVISDNDESGRKYCNDVVTATRNMAATVQVLDLKKYFPELPEKADITDVYESIGDEAVRELLKRAELEEPVATPEGIGADLGIGTKIPVWLTFETGRDGTPKYGIDEVAFADDFKERNSLVCLNGILHNSQGMVSEQKIGSMIFKEIAKYFKKGLPIKEKTLLAAVKSASFIENREPAFNEIHCINATLRVEKDKPWQVNEPEFATSRLIVSYQNEAPEPLEWKRFLSELFYVEDIDCFQEFLGYCLIPTTIAQKCLNVVGHGGEGKSRIGVVCNQIFGNTMISEKIGKIAEDRFLLSQLAGKNLFFDDDLDTRKLTDTGLFKSLVSNELEIQVERKGLDKYRLKPFAKFLICGNSQLASCFDKTDGFYRRMMVMKCRPKTRSEELDDPFLGEKLCLEKEGIFLWMLEGLQRLIDNNFKFSISPRMKENLRQAREDDTNIIAFIRDDENLEHCKEGAIASKDLLVLYKNWCASNAEVPLADRTFLEYLKGNQEKLGIEYTDQMKLGSNGSRARGYKGLTVTKSGSKVLKTQA